MPKASSFDPIFHPDDLIRLGCEGFLVDEVCAEWNISRDTFFRWIRENESMSDAYHLYKPKRGSYLIRHAKSGLHTKNFQADCWTRLMRLAGNNTDERAIYLPELKNAKNYTQQCDAIRNALSDGLLTPREAKAMTEKIALDAKVEEVTEMRKELDAIKAQLSMTS